MGAGMSDFGGPAFRLSPMPSMPSPARLFVLLTALAGCSATRVAPEAPMAGASTSAASDSLHFPGETHLRNIRQLTFGGNNAEAYWSPDGRQLIFQSDWAALNPQGCDQQFLVNADGSALSGPGAIGRGPRACPRRYRLVSTGRGRTTCGYFLPATGPYAGRVLYASTHAAAPACPASADARGRYVWDIFPTFDIYTATPGRPRRAPARRRPGLRRRGDRQPRRPLPDLHVDALGRPGAVAPRARHGRAAPADRHAGLRRRGLFLARHPSDRLARLAPDRRALDEYRALLARDVIEPGALNLFVANIDGSGARQVTDLPGANWAPFFHPNGRQIVFATNHRSVQDGSGGRTFDLYRVNTDGSGLERLTFSDTFDAFPMFSPDGSKLVFASNRRADRQPSRDTNLFVADWVE